MPKDPSKTEKATEKAIQDAKKSGNVLTSQELNSLAIVLAGVLLLFLTFRQMHDGFHNMYYLILDIDCRKTWNISHYSHGAMYGAQILTQILMPFFLVISIVAIAVIRAQTGHYFETEPLHWKLDQLNPVTGMKQIMPSVKNTVKLKVSVIALFVYFAIKQDMDNIMSLPLQPLKTGVLWVFDRSAILIFQILALFGVLAIIDYIWQHKKYHDDLMMTKQEVKDERKNAEGDQQIKGKIQQKMRELTLMKIIVEVPKADVVITNPIHVAVAIRYEKGFAAPKVVAKGLRKRAQRIKQIAIDSGVPIIEEPPLARNLYRTTRLGKFIPSGLFSAVAAILAQLHNSGKKHYSI